MKNYRNNDKVWFRVRRAWVTLTVPETFLLVHNTYRPVLKPLKMIVLSVDLSPTWIHLGDWKNIGVVYGINGFNSGMLIMVSGVGCMLEELEKQLGFKTKLIWKNIILIFGYHILGVYWSIHYAFPAKWQTMVFAIIVLILAGFGITAGVHRYWTHRAYKTYRCCQVALLVFFALAGQSTVRSWVRNHRLHHKYSDTAFDPHDSTRGLFYSHIGWLMMKKDQETIRKGKQIDFRDIDNDPLVMWHERHGLLMNFVVSLIIPVVLNVWWFEESWRCAVAWQCFIRYIAVVHSECTVNSLAHAFGYRPYNQKIVPKENHFVALITGGEGYHNYHHTFPFDYRASEASMFSGTTVALNVFKYFGLIWDCREATPEMVESVKERLGDKCAGGGNASNTYDSISTNGFFG